MGLSHSGHGMAPHHPLRFRLRLRDSSLHLLLLLVLVHPWCPAQAHPPRAEEVGSGRGKRDESGGKAELSASLVQAEPPHSHSPSFSFPASHSFSAPGEKEGVTGFVLDPRVDGAEAHGSVPRETTAKGNGGKGNGEKGNGEKGNGGKGNGEEGSKQGLYWTGPKRIHAPRDSTRVRSHTFVNQANPTTASSSFPHPSTGGPMQGHSKDTPGYTRSVGRVVEGQRDSQGGSSERAPRTLLSWAGLAGDDRAGPVEYHFGKVMAREITVYLIFYGDWQEASGQQVLEGFVEGLSDSSKDGQGIPTVHEWWNLATMYTEKLKTGRVHSVSPSVVLGNSTVINNNYSQQLSDTAVGKYDDFAQIIIYLIHSHRLPYDPYGVYMVLTSKDVLVGKDGEGFCAAYCGWHSWAQLPSGEVLHYAFVGDPSSQCNTRCGGSLGSSGSPNGFYGPDSMVDTLAHELIECATNPDVLTGWWALDQDGKTQQEIGDLCSGVYIDETYPVLNTNQDRTYSFNLASPGGFRYLVQTVVNPRTQDCALTNNSLVGTSRIALSSSIRFRRQDFLSTLFMFMFLVPTLLLSWW